jgi:hypothetical protein
MGLGLVILARVTRGSGDVEVPQAHRPEPVGEAEVADHPVDGELGGAVGVRRARRGVLADRDLVGLPVDRARRGEHEPCDAGRVHRLEQVERAGHVRAVVALGVAHRLRDERERREMEHAVEPLADRLGHLRLIAQIGFDEPGVGGDRLAVPALEIVEHDDLVAALQKLPGDDRSDVAGAAGDEQFHGVAVSLSWGFRCMRSVR